MGRVSLQCGTVNLRRTLCVSLLPDMNLLPRSCMLDVSAQTYISHVTVLQLHVAVKSRTTFLSTAEIYTPHSHTMAQCLAQGHMAVDGHISCGGDQTCDLFMTGQSFQPPDHPAATNSHWGYFNKVS